MPNKFCIYVLLLIFFSSNSWSQLADRYVPDGITKNEIKVLRILGADDKPYLSWHKNTFEFEEITAIFKTVGEIYSCKALATANDLDYFTTQDLKNAVDTAAQKIRQSKIIRSDANSFRFEHRTALYSFRQISSKDQDLLLEILDTNEGIRILKNLLALRVIEELDTSVSGSGHPALYGVRVALMKDFFIESERLAWIQSALMVIDPDSVLMFNRIKRLDAIDNFDSPELQLFGKFFIGKSKAIQNSLISSLPEVERSNLLILLKNPFFSNWTLANTAFLPGPPYPLDKFSYKQFAGTFFINNPRVHPGMVAQKILEAFPAPNQYENSMLDIGPKELISNQHLQFCK
jgi:hypothetical protein